MLQNLRKNRAVISFIVIAHLVLTIAGCGTTSSSSPVAKNVILIIGDGMQLEHERAANNYLYGTSESGIEHQTFSYKGAVSSWDVQTYNRYAFANGSTKTITGNDFDPQNSSSFTATMGYDPSKGGKLPYRQDTTGQTSYFGTKLKLSAADTANPDNPATDSASAATALATGFKTDSGNINWRTGGKQPDSGKQPDNGKLVTIAEMYRNQRKASIGVISTVPFSHATPAGFASHNKSRNNYTQIAQEMITSVRPDVVIGGGHPNYNDAAGITGKNAYQYIGEPEYNLLKNSSTTSGYTYVERKAGVVGSSSLLAAADAAVAGGKKLFGLYGGVGGNFEYHKVSNDGSATINRGSVENPTLADASRAALKVLSQNSNGFFLMVEQGDIDWANHSNDYAGMIGGVWDLNNAVKSIEAFIDSKTSPNLTWDNTLVIVTSDHGNSYMRLKKDLPKGKLPKQNPINDGGAPAGYDSSVSYYYDPSEVTYGFGEKGINAHTNELVTLYARGAGSNGFSGFEGSWYPGTRIIDNTHIYLTMMSALGLADENRSK
ncbi:MAG: alkaline phosphatase [Desulfuromonadales bacterium]